MTHQANPLPIHSFDGTEIYYQGPNLTLGPLPALFFFALSAKMSLYEDPFNQPILALSNQSIRTFSWDLPFHTKQDDPREGMRRWAMEFMHHPEFMNEFIITSQKHIEFLIEQGYVDAKHMGVAGLSRGGFIATHLAAKMPQLNIILGFAPLTKPRPLEEFAQIPYDIYESVALSHLSDQLTHKQLRFYIGNDDQRVGTAACFEFIKILVDKAVAKGIRSPQVELIIYPSIGYKGHGTPSHIFQEGAHWITSQMLK